MKYTIIAIVVFLFSMDAFAQTSLQTMAKIEILVENDLKGNEDRIRQEAQTLTNVENNLLYTSLSYAAEDTILPFTLNTILGFGIGSFVQGDILGGGIGLALDLVSLGIGGTGAALFFVSGVTFVPRLLSDISGQATPTLDEAEHFGRIGVSLIITYAVMYGGSRIFQMVRPWTYASSYNNDLKDVLGINEIGLSIVPSYNLNSSSPEIVATVAIKL